ncbi:MAG: CRISPR-associated endoribonuclease Cas6 [Ignavibacteria bacterium]|nr:CRISPR-associated endoribonuclease Cas6 [Ignavibacteria bacterium]
MSLLSIVFTLHPSDSGLVRIDQGRALYAAFLNWVNKVDENYSNSLHNEKTIKPFTVSPLFGNLHPKKGEIQINTGDTLYFRVTSFSPQMSDVVKKVIDNPLPDIQIGEIKNTVEIAKDHSWNRQSTYETLISQTLINPNRPDLQMESEFFSPTAFHITDRKYMCFPFPDSVFGSWFNNWNKYSPLSFPIETKKFINEKLNVSRFSLKSSTVHYQGAFTGFTGSCRFIATEPDPYWLRVMQALWQFSFYCGTGHHTTIGLGQTRPMEKVVSAMQDAIICNNPAEEK